MNPSTTDTSIMQADTIAKESFSKALARYPSVVEAISVSRGVKDGQKTLMELDRYRYNEAPMIFGLPKPQRSMTLEDVKRLVEWKLRHGKFRPTLMKLVSSNDAVAAQDIIKKAFHVYQKDNDVSKALDTLTKLRGIGPATASLLLSVHDPEQVIFFSDEAFYWLCCNGKKAQIRYSAKEYQALRSKANEVTERLNVPSTDVEKVSFVLMQDGVSTPHKTPARKSEPKQRKGTDTDTATTMSKPAKRELEADKDEAQEGDRLRRSKRTRAKA